MTEPDVILHYVKERNENQPVKGSNKFYHMYKMDDGRFYARYGREGTDGQKTRIYSANQWDKKYREKIRKGYIDVTPKEEVKVSSGFVDLDDPFVQKFLTLLMNISKQRVISTYQISSIDVTAYAVQQAQEILDEFVYESNEGRSVRYLNNILLRLFAFLPRKMDIVDNYLLTDKDDLTSILEREQDNLDALSSQVDLQDNSESKTVTEALGIKIGRSDPSELPIQFPQKTREVFEVTNLKTQKKYERFLEKVEGKTIYGFHGSTDSNWLGILQSGLKIKPAGVVANGNLFGNGIYLSTNITKSLNYCRGNHKIMGVFEAFVGKQKIVSNYSYETQRYTLDRVESMGYNSVYVDRFGADEIIVYKPSQVTIKYIFRL